MNEPLLPQVRIFETPETLFENAAEYILEIISQRLSPQASPGISGPIPKEDSLFHLALSGGKTPEGLYRTMASAAFRDRFPWKKIHFFWGDERCVPPTDPRSNFRMTKETLLDPAGIPKENIHPIPTSLPDSAACAEKYEEDLRRFFKGTVPMRGQSPLQASQSPFPSFDLMLLGLGEDGHTASLFPGDPACEEKSKWVSAARQDSPEPRITLTFPVLQAAHRVLFLVSGSSKRSVLETILRQKEGFEKFPAGRIRPSFGKLQWFIDASAAF